MSKTVLEEFVAVLGFEIDNKVLDQYRERGERLKTMFGGLAKAAGIVTAAFSAGFVTVNRETAKVDALASSVSVATDEILALENAVRPLGFDFEKVVDLVEELNNKMGESRGLGKPVSAISDAMKILNLNYETFKNLAPEEQFYTLTDAALKLGDSQKAASALDMVMGGDANKIIGFMRERGMSLREIVDEQRKYIYVTEAGVKGSKRFDSALLSAYSAGKSLLQEVFGRMGETLAPLVEDALAWANANRGLIASTVVKWAREFATVVEALWKFFKEITGLMSSLVERLGGLKNTIILTTAAFTAFVAVNVSLWLISATKALKALVVQALISDKVMKGLGIAATIAKWVLPLLLFALVLQDIWYFFKGKKSFVGDMSKEFEGLIGTVSDYWAEVFGMKPDEFAYMWVRGLDKIVFFFTRDIPNAVSSWIDFMGSEIGSRVSGILLAPFVPLMKFLAYLFTGQIPNLLIGTWNSIATFFSNLGTGIYDAVVGAVDSVFSWFRGRLAGLYSLLPAGVKSFLGVPSISGAAEAPGGGPPPPRPGVNTGAAVAPAFVPLGGNTTSTSTATTDNRKFEVNVPATVTINGAGDMSPAAVARFNKEIGTQIAKEVSRAVRNTGEGLAY